MTLKRTNYGRGHGYKIDGRKVPGVTTLIGDGLPKPNLTYWAAGAVATYVATAGPDVLDALRSLGQDGMIKALKNIPWSQRDAAAVRGTAVHKLAERLSHGEEVDVPDELVGYVEACVSFLNDTRIAPVVTELPVGNRTYGYGGTADMIGDFPDGRRALIDYKTASSGVWPETALQLAAYRHAEICSVDGHEFPMSDLRVSCTYAVWLRSDGYELIPVETSEEVFEVFKAVAAVARSKEVMRSWIGEAEDWRPARPVAA